MDFKNIKINYPHPTFVMMPFEEQWYGWILQGFRELGCQIVFSDEKTKQSRRELENCFTAFSIEYAGKIIDCVYDWSDFKVINDAKFPKYDLHFKIQYHKEHYSRRKTLPIGQTATNLGFMGIIPSLRDKVAKTAYLSDITAVFRATNLPERSKCVRAVKNTGFRVVAGVSERLGKLPDLDVLIDKMGYLEHLNIQAESKICVAMFGIEGDWTWRHTEILAMGGCMMTLESDYQMPDNPKDAWITIKRDFSDLKAKAEYYLTHESERREIAKRGQQYFEDYLSPIAQARYIIYRVEKII